MPDQNDLFSQPAQASQPSTQAPESLSDALNEVEEDNMESISGLSEQQIRESVAQQVEQARRNSASSQASDGTGAASDSVSGSEGSEGATDSEAPAGTGLSEFLSSEEAESAQAGAHGAGAGAAAGSASGAASGTSGVAGHRTAMGSAASVATATAGAAAAGAAGAAATSGRSRSAVDQPEIVSNRRKPRRVRVPKARRMRLSIVKFDPWSVAKVSFMLGIANGIIQVVCATILWWMLDAIGVFDKVSSLVNSTGLTGKTGFNVSAILSMGQVVSAVTIFAIFELVLIVIIAVVCAFLYNVVSSLVGGLHVVLGDD